MARKATKATKATKSAPVTYAAFDAADYLDNEEVIAAYLSEMAAAGDDQLFLEALGDVARARGMSQLAKDSGLGRESLYKALRPGANPRHYTIKLVLGAMGFRFGVVPSTDSGVWAQATASASRVLKKGLSRKAPAKVAAKAATKPRTKTSSKAALAKELQD